MRLELARCTTYGLIWHFIGECVFSLGELYKQKLFKDKIGTIFQVSDTKSKKWYLYCSTGFSCPFPFLSVSFQAQSGAAGKREKYLGQD